MNKFAASVNDFKTSGCEDAKTSNPRNTPFENLLGQRVGKLNEPFDGKVSTGRYSSELTVTRDNSFSVEDTRRIVIDCDQVTFLTDCARIILKDGDLSGFINKTKRIVINGISFVKEDESKS